MPFVVGETVGPYRLLEQLGQGGMATVFKAYHAALDRYVAIKVLHQAFTIEPNFLTRFQREAQVVAKLEHPNIVPVYDYAEHEGRPYLVMKFIEGETLKAHLKRNKLDEALLLRIVKGVGAGLGYAHEQGVLHRDVKPSNVLLANDGRIYLADFGLARMAQAGESTISSDVMLGTPQYISPEQALGQRDLDQGTDIYSFGVLLYELLVGRVPYSADTPYSIIHDHIYAPLPLPRSINPDLSEAYERILLKALAKDRSDRFPDVNTLVEAWITASTEQPGKPLAKADHNEQEISSDEYPVNVNGSSEASVSESLFAVDEMISRRPLPVQSPKLAAPDTSIRKNGWVWIVLSIVAIMVCLAAAWAAFPRLRGAVRRLGLQAQDTQTQQLAESQSTEALGALASPTKLPPVKTGVPVEGTSIPQRTMSNTQAAISVQQTDLETLRKKAEENPGDPYARFDLALFYWQNGMEALGELEFNKALRVAGQDGEFYAAAGNILLAEQRWLAAARVFLQAVRYTDPNKLVDLRERMLMALYLSASDPGAGVLLDNEGLSSLRYDPNLIEVLRARHSLYNGDPDKAEMVLENLQDQRVELYEIKLLEAEILLFKGEKDEAQQKLIALSKDQSAPNWVVKIANHLLVEKFEYRG